MAKVLLLIHYPDVWWGGPVLWQMFFHFFYVPNYFVFFDFFFKLVTEKCFSVFHFLKYLNHLKLSHAKFSK